MARIGVTYQDIENAANQLVGQGKQPTIELIRHFLGTGSSTTIANHLRQWRAEQDGSFSLSKAENLPKEMISLMKGLWDKLCGDAQQKITTIEIKHQQLITELQQEAQKYKNNNQRWQQLFNQWTQEKEQFTRDKITLEQGIDILQKEKTNLENKIESQTQQLEEKQQRIGELHRLHSQAQTNLEHFRESTREQRMREQQQFEQQKQEWQMEMKLTKEQFALLQQKTTDLQQKHQILQQAHHNLEKTHEILENKLEKTQQTINHLENEKNKLIYDNQHFQKKAQEQEKSIAIKIQEITDLQIENKILTKNLAEVQQTYDESKDQIKLLGHEKWILAQEKSQLEGQLKQMQKIVMV